MDKINELHYKKRPVGTTKGAVAIKLCRHYGDLNVKASDHALSA